MIYDYHILLGSVAVIIGILGYVAYYRDMFAGITKPHPFSWLGFGLLNGIVYVAQIVRGGGAGSWVTAITALGCLGIAGFGLKRGKKDITIFDWICFIGSLAGIALWVAMKDPLGAVIVATITDTIAFAPTYRKAYLKPYEETVSMYVSAFVKYGISIVALSSVSWTTALFPAWLTIVNVALVILLLLRRKTVSRSA